MPDRQARVLLADSQLLVLKSLERLLADEFEVMDTVTDGWELLQAASEGPDVIVSDSSMPEMHGSEATRRLVAQDPEAKVVVLGSQADLSHVQASFRAGARGYVTKSDAPEDLLTAIREVAQGRYYTSPSVTGALVRSLRSSNKSTQGAAYRCEDPALSPREREVLDRVGQGYSNRQIADRLCISEATVRSHLSRLYDKLDLSNRVELALHAVQSPHLVESTSSSPPR